MEIYKYGDLDASIILIQTVGNHDLPEIEHEVSEIKKLTGIKFQLIAVKVDSWNYDLAPWRASAVFGNENFGDGAQRTLAKVLEICSDRSKTYYIGGYSLAGLFSLWASYQTDIFTGTAAVSPSIWYPEFVTYMKTHDCKSGKVYLSLGDKEEKTKNTVMSKVGECIREAYQILIENKCDCILEWNQGGHFKDSALRTAKAFAWIIDKEVS